MTRDDGTRDEGMQLMPPTFEDFTRMVEDDMRVRKSTRKTAEPMDYIEAMYVILSNVINSLAAHETQLNDMQPGPGRHQKDK